MNGHHRREAWPKPVLKRMPRIERDLHRNSLDDLGEIPRRVIRRKQGELRSAGRGYLCNLPVEHHSGKLIDRDIGDVALSDIGQLRLLVVRLAQTSPFDQIDQLHTGSHQLSLLHMTFADCTRPWSKTRVYPRLTWATTIAACLA